MIHKRNKAKDSSEPQSPKRYSRPLRERPTPPSSPRRYHSTGGSECENIRASPTSSSDESTAKPLKSHGVGLNFRLLRTKDSAELLRERFGIQKKTKKIPGDHYRRGSHRNQEVQEQEAASSPTPEQRDDAKQRTATSTPPPSPAAHNKDVATVVVTPETQSVLNVPEDQGTAEVLQKLMDALGMGTSPTADGGSGGTYDGNNKVGKRMLLPHGGQRRRPPVSRHLSFLRNNGHHGPNRHGLSRHRSSESLHGLV